MNNIGLTLTADARQMIKALQDVDKATTAALGHSAASARQLEQAARDAGIAMGGMASNANIRQMAALSKQVDQLGLSSKQTAAALRGVPAQFTDIVVSLQGGQNPLTVLLQQGGQLKDMFNGVIPAIRAMGGYVLSELRNPVKLAIAAIVALGTAIHQASKEQQMLRDSIALTGGASGVTTDQLNAMAARMAVGFGATTGKAIDALVAMNQTGQIARTSLEDFAATAILIEKRFGQSIEDTAKNFAELGKDPVGASKRLNESMNYLTASTYEQIRAAVEIGDKTRAATLAQQAYDQALKVSANDVDQNLGYVEKAWRNILAGVAASWKAMKEVWDWIKGLGREDPLAQQLEKAEAKLKDRQEALKQYGNRGGLFGGTTVEQIAQEQAKIDLLQEQIRLSKKAGDDRRSEVLSEKAGIAAVDKAAEEAKKNREARDAAAKKAAEDAMRVIEDGVKLQQSLTAKDSGLSPEFAKQWDSLGKAYKANKISLDQLLESQRLLLDQQPFAKEQAKEREDAAKREAKQIEETAKREAEGLKITNQLREDSIKPFEQALKAQQKRVESLEQEEAAIAISEKMNVSLAQAVEMVNIARLEEMKTAARAAENFDAVEMIQKEIEEREKLVKLIGSKEARDASAKAAKQAADDWKKASDKIQDSITDALMRGFENGKGFVKNLVDTIKNMFNTMVLRPIVQAVVGTAAGAFGLGAPGSAGAGSLSGLASAAIDQYAQSAITTALMTSNAAYGAAIGTTSIGAGSQAAMLAAQTSGFGTAGTLATAQAAGTGSSMMANAAAAGPYVAAALVALNALGVFRSKKVVGGGLMGTLGQGDIQSYDLQRRGGTLFNGPSYSIVNQRTSPESKALQEAFLAMRATTVDLAGQIGIYADDVRRFTTSIGNDLIQPDTGGRGLKFDGLSAEQSAQKIEAALISANEQMARMVLTTSEKVSYQIRIFGRTIDRSFERIIDPEKWMKEGETAVQALTRLSGSLSAVNTVFGNLNQTLFATSLSGADAASKLIDVFGGLENFQQATSAYYQAFYTEAEKNAKVQEAIQKALSSVNLTMPSTLSGFRFLVEAQDLNTESGRANYAVLMQLAPAFAQLTNSMAAAGSSASDVSDSILAMADAERIYKEAFDLAKPKTMADVENSVLSSFNSIGLLEMQGFKQIKTRWSFFEKLLGFSRTFEQVPNMVAASLPKTIEQFDALVNAQDVLTESGRAAKIALMQLAPEFVSMLQMQQELAASIADERQGLQDQIDRLLGNTDALRERERNALDASNRALFDQIQALQAQQEAATAAAQAEQERAEAIKNAGRTVEEEIRRLRGLSGNTTNQAALQAQFATLTGMARAGDADALAKLPAISQAMEEASRLTAMSALDVARMRTWLSGSLSDTMKALALDVPAFATGGVHMGGIRLVGENGPELEVTGPSRIFNAQQTAGLLGGGDAASEIRAMREELAMLRAEARATAINTGRQADLMKRVTKNGEAMTVQTDLTPLEVTTA